MTDLSWIDGSLLAALMSAIATCFAAIAILRAPTSAARLAEQLRREAEQQDERTRQQKWIFFTLMQERARLMSAAAVQALNSIDVAFLDDTKVREAWADLYHHYNVKDASPQIAEQKIRDLLREMAAVLGLSDKLRRDDFSRVYYPNALADEHYVQALHRINMKQELEGRLSSPVANTAPQMTGEATSE